MPLWVVALPAAGAMVFLAVLAYAVVSGAKRSPSPAPLAVTPNSIDLQNAQSELSKAINLQAPAPQPTTDLTESEVIPPPSPKDRNAATLDSRAIAKQMLAATVFIKVTDGKQGRTGSGFFIESNLVVTNLHVIEEATSGSVRTHDNATYQIDAVCAHSGLHDLALLRVAGTSKDTLRLADSDSADIGDSVFVTGAPRGLESTFSRGVISGRRQINGTRKVIQIDAAISPGSSGGPVCDESGSVVGVATFQVTAGQNLNFAAPSSELEKLLRHRRHNVDLATLYSRNQAYKEGRPTLYFDKDTGVSIVCPAKWNVNDGASKNEVMYAFYLEEGERFNSAVLRITKSRYPSGGLTESEMERIVAEYGFPIRRDLTGLYPKLAPKIDGASIVHSRVYECGKGSNVDFCRMLFAVVDDHIYVASMSVLDDRKFFDSMLPLGDAAIATLEFK